MKSFYFCKTDIGTITIAENNGVVTHILLGEHILGGYEKRKSDTITKACSEIEEYLNGRRKSFDISFDFEIGTVFQKSVWRTLCTIPYGQTISYSDIACMIDAPKAVRAVGAAIGKNPIFIVVPCHRVIGKNGSLTGFAYGVDLKKKLLDIESENSERKG